MSDEMISATVNSDRHGRQIAALHNALIGTGGDASTVIHSESRLLCKQVMNLTPTPGLGQDAKKRGEQSVKKDLMKLFTPVTDEFLNVVLEQFGDTGIDGWLSKPGTNDHYDLKWDKIDRSGDGMASFHRSRQDRRGRVRSIKQKRVGDKWRAAYVVSYTVFDKYFEKLKSHVGWRKAAWGKHLIALGGKCPKWISRHVDAQPSQTIVGLDGAFPSVRMVSRAPAISDDERLVMDAMRIRRKPLAAHQIDFIGLRQGREAGNESSPERSGQR
jgi:hypothetical protein